MLDKEFKGKKILITGASKGLGKEISLEFNKLGAKLIMISRSKSLLDKIPKKKNLTYPIDLFDKNVLKETLEDIKKKEKFVDVIIHCLGGSFGVNNPLEGWKNFNRCLLGNIGIAIEINKTFIPMMQKKKRGNIIHVSSISGLQSNASVPYVTSKSALSGYVRTMGNYLANYNVILSGIVPGAFIGDSNAMSRFRFYKPKEYKEFVKKLPQSRMPKVSEYIPMIKNLSSSKSQIFSGSLISLDTGQGSTILQHY